MNAARTSTSCASNPWLVRLLRPSLPDLLLIAILLWVLAGNGSAGLLGDGDTGWHIRNGENILRTQSFPAADPFGFGSEGRTWFAWEWLSDVLLALLHGAGGLKAVAISAGVAIAVTQSFVFRRCLSRQVNPILALCLVLIATNASSIHYLARPHLMTLLLLSVSAWALDSDEVVMPGLFWCLPLIAVLWTNLHGGFLALFSIVGARFIDQVLNKASVRTLFRIGLLGALCLLATFVNPYGWRLYLHLSDYLGSDAIRRSVEEFQSPKFGSESMLSFEILLVLGIALLPRMIARRRFSSTILIVFWAHQALISVRHVPLYCVIAVPAIALELDELWSGWARSAARDHALAIVRSIGEDWRGSGIAMSVAPLVVIAGLFLLPSFCVWPVDFPAARFPSTIVSRSWPVIAASHSSGPTRIFSTDQWSDYLIYKFYPRIRTFFDGRSDFFLPWRGDAYHALMEGKPGCSAILDREHVSLALVPAQWPLAGYLRDSSSWKILDRDETAVLFVRR